MTKVNYAGMSDQELKRYLLCYRDDDEAFYAYMARRQSRPRDTVIELNDPAWEEKITALIQKQISSVQ